MLASETAKYKFNMNYGPRKQKSISSAIAAGNLQNSPERIKALQMNNSMVSLNGGKMPSVYESTQLISQTILRDHSQGQLGMQINSSKAFDLKQHYALLDIIQKIEKSAKSKYKAEM